MLPVETVRVHIHRFSFDTMYTKWIHHGKVEAASSTDPIVSELIEEMFVVWNDVAGINDDHDTLDETEVGIEDA